MKIVSKCANLSICATHLLEGGERPAEQSSSKQLQRFFLSKATFGMETRTNIIITFNQNNVKSDNAGIKYFLNMGYFNTFNIIF